ncbi:hypothetical protein VNI00_003077 [Paramarasmius palmivorus]|uniref:FAD dependent oxidoreductase domain-containing protein n=1 Tax=Paramarasmius palmivorus TaxID=297713 RepID=A0AAW0DVM1_9AGAR
MASSDFHTRATPPTHPLDANLPAPGLPLPKPCLSIWQRTTRNNPLLNQGSSSPLPSKADVVIIGSGLSGTLTAFELSSRKNVVILEAREACSGATGRNAGHCRPDAFRGFTAFSKIHGREQAFKILQHEKLVLQLVKGFIDKYGIECDFDLCKTFDVVMGEEFGEYVKASWEEYVHAHGKDGGVEGVRVLNAEEAKKETRVPAALGAYEWTAANLHPAKLCLSILQMCCDRGVQLYTHTPVTGVSQAGDGVSWTVETSGGVIEAPIVVHATNAFAATLLPLLAEKVVPTRAQRKSDGTFVLGTSRGIPGMSVETKQQIAGGKDDRVWNKEIQDDALSVFGDVFLKNEDEPVVGEGHEFGWTGVIGMTNDSVPFIGAVPGKPGQWVIAGFNGHAGKAWLGYLAAHLAWLK